MSWCSFNVIVIKGIVEYNALQMTQLSYLGGELDPINIIAKQTWIVIILNQDFLIPESIAL